MLVARQASFRGEEDFITGEKNRAERARSHEDIPLGFLKVWDLPYLSYILSKQLMCIDG